MADDDEEPDEFTHDIKPLPLSWQPSGTSRSPGCESWRWPNATALHAWVFHPAVLDGVLGTQTTEDTYGRDIAKYESYSYHLNLEPEEIPRFRAFLTE